MVNDDVISMPDTWEYPWYASWDLAFHTVALAMVDIDFAKAQLELMLRELYLHPSGQLPAYEWNFSDVNPPVHAWATLLVYETELEQRGAGDVAWLKSAFQKLLVNFTWWVNRKDPTGRNVFEGGFLGLDNIGVFDRSAAAARPAGSLEQSDGTAWMAFFAQCMLGIALELSQHDPLYEDMVLKFAEHFLFIAAAMDRIGDNQDELWDEEDGFFYDVLRLPDGQAQRLKVRSMVGLLPLCATTVLPIEGDRGQRRARWPGCAAGSRPCPSCSPPSTTPAVPGRQRPADAGRARRDQAAPRPRPHARRGRVPQPARPAGAVAATTPTTRTASTSTASATRSATCRPSPTPGCSAATRTGAARCGSRSTTSCCAACCTCTRTTATTSRSSARPARAASARCSRWRRRSAGGSSSIFLPDADGRRPVYGGTERFQTDPHWKDLLLFYEYFHGDNGAGLGASHQTGLDRARRPDHPGARLPAARGPAGRRAARERRCSSRTERVSGPWPAHPVIYELNTAAWLHDVGASARGARDDAGRRARRRVGRGDPARRRRRVADGRVGAQPGRRAAGARHARADGVVPRRAARPHRGRRHRLGLLHPPATRSTRASAAAPAWPPPGPRSPSAGVRLARRLRAEPRRPRPPLAHRAPRVLRPGHAPTTSPAIPAAFLAVGDAVIARGRDPYFPPWPDVAQLERLRPRAARGPRPTR